MPQPGEPRLTLLAASHDLLDQALRCYIAATVGDRHTAQAALTLTRAKTDAVERALYRRRKEAT